MTGLLVLRKLVVVESSPPSPQQPHPPNNCEVFKFERPAEPNGRPTAEGKTSLSGGKCGKLEIVQPSPSSFPPFSFTSHTHILTVFMRLYKFNGLPFILILPKWNKYIVSIGSMNVFKTYRLQMPFSRFTKHMSRYVLMDKVNNQLLLLAEP